MEFRSENSPGDTSDMAEVLGVFPVKTLERGKDLVVGVGMVGGGEREMGVG